MQKLPIFFLLIVSNLIKVLQLSRGSQNCQNITVITRYYNIWGLTIKYANLNIQKNFSEANTPVSCNGMSAVVAPSGECLRGEGLVSLVGGGGGVFAGCLPRVQYCSLACAMDGRFRAAAPLALADQLPLR